jgi:thioesterase domain-containing protein/acyl carrier protein
MMTSLAPRLTQRAEAMERRAPRIPLVSNLTGRWLTDEEARDSSYWARHLCGTVRFAAGLATLLADSEHVLVEVGPGRTLATLARRHPAADPRRLVTTTLAAPSSDRSDLETLLCAVGQLWCAGVPVDWSAFWRGEQRRRVPLPTYPFERTPYVLGDAPSARRAHWNEGHAPPRAPTRRGGAPPNRADAAEDPVAQALTTIWQEALGVEDFGAEDNFFDLGGSSFLAVQVRSKVHDRLGVQLPVHALLEAPTLRTLATRVREALPPGPEAGDPPADRPSNRTAPAPARPRLLVKLSQGPANDAHDAAARGGVRALFMVQPIGGTVYTYLPFARALGAGVPVVGIRASGMEPEEPILDDIGAIASLYIDEVRSIQPSGPYLLGGHSAGGVIAYEMARQLAALGQDPALVIMLDTPSLDAARRAGIATAADLLRAAEAFRESAPQAYEGFVAAVRDGAELGSIMIATWRALTAYEPPPLEAELLYIRARDDHEPGDPHPEEHWMDLVRGPFAMHRVAGNHFSMMDPPFVAAVARKVEQHLVTMDLVPPSWRSSPAGPGRRTKSSAA